MAQETLLQKIKRHDRNPALEKIEIFYDFSYAIKDLTHLLKFGKTAEALALLERHRAEIEDAEKYLFRAWMTPQTEQA